MIAVAVLVFTVVWWISLFIALPIKVKTNANSRVGYAGGEPENAYLKIKFFIVTTIASVATFAYCYLKLHGYLDIDMEFLYDLVP